MCSNEPLFCVLEVVSGEVEGLENFRGFFIVFLSFCRGLMGFWRHGKGGFGLRRPLVWEPDEQFGVAFEGFWKPEPRDLAPSQFCLLEATQALIRFKIVSKLRIWPFFEGFGARGTLTSRCGTPVPTPPLGRGRQGASEAPLFCAWDDPEARVPRESKTPPNPLRSSPFAVKFEGSFIN